MNEGSARVLEALLAADGARCSGESLKALLGVSRAAVWKHVESLRERGYGIEGAPGGGYVLTVLPDRLYPERLATDARRWLATSVHHFEETDSTNRVAFELARDGAPAGTTVVAERQTAGRGRLGRSFFSPAHQNLYASVVLRPRLHIAQAPPLILAAAVAVAEATADTLGAPERVEIKWPNDVLVDGLKVSGILMEMNAEATHVGFAILGIGVNLNVARDEFPDEFRARATSLRSAVGEPVDRVAFVRRLFGILEDVLDLHAAAGWSGVAGRFDAWFRMPGREVEVHGMQGEVLRGVARGIAEDGALEVERFDGRVDRVVAGDVTLSPRRTPAAANATDYEANRELG